MTLEESMKPAYDTLFSGSGWRGFASVLEEFGMEANPDTCREAFNLLPATMKAEFLVWGLGDTCVNDDAYVHLRDKHSDKYRKES